MKSKFLLLILLPAALLVHIKSAAQAVNVQDSIALVNLYDSAGGTKWTTKTNWLTTKPVSTWYGLTETAGRVTEISLYENNLTGSITATLGNLAALQVLDLQINSLTGAMPASLGNLSNLEFLALNGNLITGSIPATFGNLTKLQDLYLGYLGDGNLIGGPIPTSLGNLTNLKVLDLDNNGITGQIPSTLSTLTKLIYIDLDGNLLNGSIPSFLGTFSGLTYLDLNTNLFKGAIPSSLGSPTNLTYLDLYDNQLTGTIPASISTLTKLTTLDLGYNLLTGRIPTAISSSKLTLLDLGYNNLTGSVPASIGNLDSLNYLDISANQLADSIPSTLDKLSKLTVFQLGSDQFTFAGMEGIAKAYKFAGYAPQANIPLHINGNTLSVSVGGTLSNNTYAWYKNDGLIATNTGDSSYTITSTGTYEVVVTNAVAKLLTLYSDSLVINALPLKLLNFTGALQNSNVKLQWQTTNEINTQSFVVEHGINGTTFTAIGTVAADDVSGINDYAFTDTKPASGVNYYRLEMLDKDGNFTYSNIVNVNVGATAFEFSVYPNPVVNATTVSFNEVVAGKYKLQITDVSGKILNTIEGVSTVGTNTVKIDCTNYASGTYFITFSDGVNGKQTFKLAK